MTMWYDEDREVFVQSRADLHVEMVKDGGEMELDLSDEHQKREFVNQAEVLKGELYSVKEGDEVWFVDENGDEHEAIVTETWGGGTINVHYPEEGGLTKATSVVPESPEVEILCWYK